MNRGQYCFVCGGRFRPGEKTPCSDECRDVLDILHEVHLADAPLTADEEREDRASRMRVRVHYPERH